MTSSYLYEHFHLITGQPNSAAIQILPKHGSFPNACCSSELTIPFYEQRHGFNVDV